MRPSIATICLLAALPFSAFSEPPSAQISNGLIHAKLYLPDAQTGYYRAARFDWSGVIASLEYSRHQYFGVWFPHYDPYLNDAITGPVEEFRSDAQPPLDPPSFDEAKAGGKFLKIGVGILKKPDDRPYVFSRPYDIVNGGTWTAKPNAQEVAFVQELKDDSGYSYRYKKTVRLVKGKPELVLEHHLKNTGTKTIESDVYDHDFFVIDGQPTGPDFHVIFGFKPAPQEGFKDLAELRGNELVYLKELTGHESAFSHLTGFGASPSDNHIRVENAKTGAGVEETGDHPLSSFFLWSIHTTVCPEAFIHIKVAPGQETSWTIHYRFYTITHK